MDHAALQAAFVAAVPESQRAAARGPAVSRALAAQATAAEEAHPEVHVSEALFAARLARCAKGEDLAGALSALCAPDLWLACGCAQGDRHALAVLEQRLADAVPRAVARLRADAAFCDEVAQLLRQKLLVGGPSGAPKIEDYAGRGALAQWLRAAALRVALNLLDGNKASRADDEGSLSRLPAGGPDPELSLVKRRYAPEFQAALTAALSGLPDKERNLLRLYFAQGMTVEEIGRIEGTHKSTISRWLTRARAGLLQDVRTRLGTRLKLSDSELDSLLSVVRSQLNLSLRRVLA